MTVYYLNCGTMRPYFPRVENGVTCLLVETNQGLVLVDTGFGMDDYLCPDRVTRLFRAAVRSPGDVGETTLHQVQRLGYQPQDVRHIVMTHLHLDHAGGLPDFPHAKIHLYRPEYEYIRGGHTGWGFRERHWAHGPDWVPHELAGERWYDYAAVRLAGFEPEIWLVPLVGHTPGHSGVAIRATVRGRDGWVLHGGDAVPFNVAVAVVPDWISSLLIGPHVPRIRTFMRAHPEVKVVGAHMRLDFYEQV